MPDPHALAVTLSVADLEALVSRAVAAALEEHREPPAPALLDRAQLAHALGVSPRTLDTLRRGPSFPELRVGDAPRFRLDAVLGWLADRGDQ